MSEKYTILVEAVLNKANIQSQLSGMKSTAKITVNNSDMEKRNRLIDQYNNKLELLQIRNKKAFESSEVQQNADNLKNLIKTYDGTTAAKYKLQNASEKLTNSVANFNEGIKNVNKNGLSLNDMFGIAAKKMLIWAVATEALYGSLKKLDEGVQFIKDLNKALTDIQIVTGQTKEEVAGLATQYNSMARDMGATTLQISEGTLTFIRQGKSAEESAILVKNSMIISKLAAIDSAQASEYLTSVMNGYKLSAEDTTRVIDSMVAVDNAAATSVKELAEAMQRTSNIAQMAGVPIQDLISYIGTVSSVTRKSAESIGESFCDLLYY
ncbi:MAG: phage tail tape measure protein [Candidatus Paceibacterota bacterium]